MGLGRPLMAAISGHLRGAVSAAKGWARKCPWGTQKETRRSGFLMMVCCAAYANLRRFQPSGAMIISKIINPAAAGYLIA
jgi:hypothetical protein